MTSSAFDWPEGESPLEELKDPVFERSGITVKMKRDDLIEPFGGNKGRKLKYAWRAFVESGKNGLITMGGPFSNHIHAFARMCSHFAVPGKVLIRGEVDDNSNPVLKFVRSCGVQVFTMPRSVYATRYLEGFRLSIGHKYPDDFFIPEGGAGATGVAGCAEIMDEILQQSEAIPDFILVSAGTGTTAVGMASRLRKGARLIAVSAMKREVITTSFGQSLELLGSNSVMPELNSDYHFGGFARWNDQLIHFIRDFERRQGIRLDPIYTGKTMFALFDMAKNGVYPEGSKIIVVHTGGIPGREGFNYRFPGLLESLS